MTYFFETYGCEMNIAESAAIEQLFISRGWSKAEEPELADMVVINTCSVTNMADRKSRQMIKRAKKMNPDAVIAAAGQEKE